MKRRRVTADGRWMTPEYRHWYSEMLIRLLDTVEALAEMPRQQFLNMEIVAPGFLQRHFEFRERLYAIINAYMDMLEASLRQMGLLP